VFVELVFLLMFGGLSAVTMSFCISLAKCRKRRFFIELDKHVVSLVVCNNEM